MDSIKRITYRPSISRFVWRFGLAGILRTLYYWLNRPSGGILVTEVNGLSASFHIRTPWEFRSLDPAGDIGRESHILERLITLVQPGDVVLDVGSNFGVYTILLAKAVGPNGVVVAIEPEEQGYQHLLDNVKLNSLDNVRAFQLALGDHNGEEKLFLEHTGASRLVQPAVANSDFAMVTVIEGDRLISSENLAVPRMVKIDVEGHEWAVIRGMTDTLKNPECQVLCCEIHTPLLPEGVHPDQVLDLLREFGFNEIEILQRGTSEFHALAQKR